MRTIWLRYAASRQRSKNFGQKTIAKGSQVTVLTEMAERGIQITRILNVTPPQINGVNGGCSETETYFPDDAYRPARIKWFDQSNGYGFLNVFGSADDYYFELRDIESTGIGSVSSGDAVEAVVISDNERRFVKSLRAWR